MPESYHKRCRELDICNELIEKFLNTQQYEKCFEGHLALAEQGYPLAEEVITAIFPLYKSGASVIE